MAKRVGVSKDTVQRVWSARGLKPHLVMTYKVSNDPKFEEKLIDVVGLYLDPLGPRGGAVHGRKSSVQALDRPQPSLPLVKGRAATMTHDYTDQARRRSRTSWPKSPAARRPHKTQLNLRHTTSR